MLIMTYIPAPSPTLEAVPGRPDLLSNSKLVKVSGDLMGGLMGSDMSASMFCGSVRVRVGSAMASGRGRGYEWHFRACRVDEMSRSEIVAGSS